MNKEDIIRTAREAELIMETDCTSPWVEDHDLTPYLERFAALVAAAEREACAQVADSQDGDDPGDAPDCTWSRCARHIAAAIRARGQQ
jgi:hypothetical protein